MATKRLIFLVAVLGLAGCAPKVDLQVARAAILETDRQFSKVTGEQGLSGFLSFLAEDVATLRPNSPIVRGKQAMGERWAPLLNDSSMKIRWEPNLGEVSASGEMGYTVGSFEITPADGQGTRVVGAGKYVTIWRKQPDGSWKVVFDSGVEDSLPQAKSQPQS